MAREHRSGIRGRLGWLGLLAMIIMATLVVFVPAAAAQTDDSSDVATVAQTDGSADVATVAQEEEDPYTAVLTHVEPPDWLERLGPLAELPVWASAAIISAVIAAVAFFVPVAVRWVWSLSAMRDSET